MNAEPKDIKTIFSEAIEKQTPEEQAAYLDQVCGNDAELRSKLDELLKAHSQAGSFLEIPDAGRNVTLDDSVQIEGPGRRIGRYELLQLIGEGGMGLVYLAEQKEPVKRRVAIKIIKPGMDSAQVIARFEAERQVLALLDHPNIAHVLDAGTTDTGRLYFVMEHVKGLSITQYCDQNKLNIEQRLKLFRQVCEGVHHAHQKGIIHRDIKPSNILISIHGDRAVPKIIDFGIAKATASALTEKTMFTFQGQLLGTPEYMSPEQVDLAMQDIDTRSDIYSLGVVLYELLAGVLPFDKESLEKLGFAELQRTLRESEPASPSIRLTSLGEKAKAIADSRMTQVVPLARRLHRELEWIPLKAMRKDRCRRYKSASDMADDIQSYLNGNPLLAGPETATYRVQKFVHKHAGSVVTAALLLVVIILGLVASIVMGCRAEQARQQEASVRKQVERALARAEKAERIAREQRKLAEERAEAYRRAMYSNNLALAKEAIDEDSVDHAQKLLKACEPELRGWEWQHLNHRSADPCIKTFRGHSDDVFSVAISPDGRRIVSSSRDKTIKVWDVGTGTNLMTLSGHNDWVGTVAFSPDGKRIISGSGDRTIKVWNATTGDEEMTLVGHAETVRTVMFSPDGKRIVSGGWDGTVKVWDAGNGSEIKTLNGHNARIYSATFSPDGTRIISGSLDDIVRVWDVATGNEIQKLLGHIDGVCSVAYSSDGKRIASGSMDQTIKVWDANTGDEEMTLSGHTGTVRTVVFSLDGKRIVSGSYDQTIKIWDAVTGEEMMTLRGHTDRIKSIKLNFNGTRIFSAAFDNTIKVWNPAIGRDILRLYGIQSMIHQIAFSPNGKYIAASFGRGIKLWDTVSGAETITLRGHNHIVASIAFSPDGKKIVSGSADTTLRIWDAASGTVERILAGHTDRIRSVAFSPDGEHVVSGGYDKTIKVWNAATGAVEMTLVGHNERIQSVIFSPDGKQIVSAGYDGTVRVWDASSGTELLVLRGHTLPRVYGVSVSPDSKRIVSCGEDKTVRVWNAQTGEELMILRGHGSDVHTVDFSPDGTRIVSADYNREVKIWDASTGRELMNLFGDSPYIRYAAFSPDGKSICIGDSEGNITVWESVEPVAGYERRQIANSAREMVDELYKRCESYDRVISELRDGEAASEPKLRVALQITNARLWEDADKLLRQIWNVVTSPDNNEVTYREALEKAEKVVISEPSNFVFIGVLGAAQYRIGAYADALATLTRAEIRRADTKARHPTISGWTAWKAMTLYQLGRDKEAKAALQKIRGSFDEWFSLGGSYSGAFLKLVVEVEKLFADKDSTLLSIWEHIEENRLDEASELIEKARQSKDADYVKRMEGAIKLLEVLNKLK